MEIIRETPLVSIIIPTYKRGPELFQRAIQSAFQQTYKNIQLVIVDDNAAPELKSFRDAVKSYCESLGNTCLNLKLIQNPSNLGGAMSRNEGIKAADGEFITFLDDDDEFLPQKVEHQIQYMIEKGCNFSFTDLSIYNENRKLIDRRERSNLASYEKEWLFKYHLTHRLTGTETFMVKKTLLEKVGMFENTPMGHEFYLMSKLLLCELTDVGYFPSDDIMAYRTSSEAISTGKNKIIGEKQILAFCKQYFYALSKNEKNYIKFRHCATMAIAHKRNKHYLKFVGYSFATVFGHPINFFKEVAIFRKNINA